MSDSRLPTPALPPTAAKPPKLTHAAFVEMSGKWSWQVREVHDHECSTGWPMDNFVAVTTVTVQTNCVLVYLNVE